MVHGSAWPTKTEPEELQRDQDHDPLARWRALEKEAGPTSLLPSLSTAASSTDFGNASGAWATVSVPTYDFEGDSDSDTEDVQPDQYEDPDEGEQRPAFAASPPSSEQNLGPLTASSQCIAAGATPCDVHVECAPSLLLRRSIRPMALELAEDAGMNRAGTDRSRSPDRGTPRSPRARIATDISQQLRASIGVETSSESSGSSTARFSSTSTLTLLDVIARTPTGGRLSAALPDERIAGWTPRTWSTGQGSSDSGPPTLRDAVSRASTCATDAGLHGVPRPERILTPPDSADSSDVVVDAPMVPAAPSHRRRQNTPWLPGARGHLAGSGAAAAYGRTTFRNLHGDGGYPY